MNDAELILSIKKRDAKLKVDAEAKHQTFQNIIDIIVPFMDDIDLANQKINQTKKIGRKQYNSHAEYCLGVWCRGMQGYTVSASSNWFVYQMARTKVRDSHVLKRWIQDTQEHMYYAYRESNFYSAIPKAMLYGGALGTAVAFTQEDVGRGVSYLDIQHPKKVRFAQNRFGEVDVIHREFILTKSEAVAEFGKDNLSAELTRDLETKPDMKHTFLHVLWPQTPNPNRNDYAGKKVLSVYLEWDKTPKIIKKEGYHQRNAHVWRVDQFGDSPWGIGPAERALMDASSANLISKDLLEASQLGVRPPMLADSDLKGKLKLGAKAINWVEGDQRVERVNLNIDMPSGIDRERKYEAILEKRFSVDFFLMLMQSERAMTATEVMEKQGEKAILQAPESCRFDTNFLKPINNHLFAIEMNAGRMPELPPELEDFVGETITMDLVGPMFRLQQRLFKTGGLQSALQDLIPIFNMAPETIAKLKMDEAVDLILDSHGVPASVIATDEEYQAIQAANNREAQLAKEMEMASQLADGASKLGGKTDPTSPLSQLMNS